METNSDVLDYQRKERKLIKTGKQKTLFDTPLDEKIDMDIVYKFSKIIQLSKIITSDENEFEAIVDTYCINTEDFEKISKVGKEIYGNDCQFHFNAESKWNIAFGVIKKNDK